MWASVYAEARSVTEDEAAFRPGIALVVTVEVVTSSGRRLGHRALVTEWHLADARFDVFGHTLDKIVARLEDAAADAGEVIL